MAHLNNRLITDLGGDVVALRRRLAVMADKDPGVGEEVLHLQSIDFGVDINIAMDLMALHQPGNGLWIIGVLLISAGASYVPARRASRISVRETLAYE